MKPLILVTPDHAAKGAEFDDLSLSLSRRYALAVQAAGGLPFALNHSESRGIIAECVARADGVLLTGGHDVSPDLYAPDLPEEVRQLARMTPDHGLRDTSEMLVLQEVFRQRKPLLAICRGHQLLNVALGGTLIVDLPTQRPSGLSHGRMDRAMEPVHEVTVETGSMLAAITGRATLGVNSTHHQAVDRVAPGLVVVARAEDGVVEALEQASDRRLLPFLVSVQWHPERLQAAHPEHRAIFTAFTAACGACC